MYKIAVIGDRDSVFGFSSVSAEIHVVTSSSQAREELQKMIKENYAIIFITEALFEELEDIFAIFNNETVPAIVPIPGVSGNTGQGMKNVDDLIEKAVGTQLLS